MTAQHLRRCFDDYTCDKGFKHGYEHVYASAFAEMFAKHGKVRLLELGVFKGASTLAFARYLSDMEIPYQFYGIDLFEREDLDEISDKLIEMHGVNVVLIKDNTQTPHQDVIDIITNFQPNIIIDDAEHTPTANKLTLESFWPTLVNPGKYFIEDIWDIADMTVNGRTHAWIKKHAEDFTMNKFEEFTDACTICDNDHEWIDLRKDNAPDSMIYMLEKWQPIEK